ncbi:MAG: hypothetical protein SOH93_00585 [Oscillospiraceae bacterium]|jgi:hypothetical protein
MQQILVIVLVAAILCFFAFYGLGRTGHANQKLKKIHFYQYGTSASAAKDSDLVKKFYSAFEECLAEQKPLTHEQRVDDDFMEAMRREKTCAEMEYEKDAPALHFLGELGNPDFLKMGYDRLFLCKEDGLLFISFHGQYQNDPVFLRNLEPVFSCLEEK